MTVESACLAASRDFFAVERAGDEFEVDSEATESGDDDLEHGRFGRLRVARTPTISASG